MTTRSTRARIPHVEALEARTVPSGFPPTTSGENLAASRDSASRQTASNAATDAVAVRPPAVDVTPVPTRPIGETTPRTDPPVDTSGSTTPTPQRPVVPLVPSAAATYGEVAAATRTVLPPIAKVEPVAGPKAEEAGSAAGSGERPARGGEGVAPAPLPRADVQEEEPIGEATRADEESVERVEPATVDEVPPLAAGLVPLNLAALDAALEGFRRQLDEATQALAEVTGGVGIAPWLAVAASMLVAYEASRRRARLEAAASVEVAS